VLTSLVVSMNLLHADLG